MSRHWLGLRLIIGLPAGHTWTVSFSERYSTGSENDLYTFDKDMPLSFRVSLCLQPSASYHLVLAGDPIAGGKDL